jgi:hypothetical protein
MSNVFSFFEHLINARPLSRKGKNAFRRPDNELICTAYSPREISPNRDCRPTEPFKSGLFSICVQKLSTRNPILISPR